MRGKLDTDKARYFWHLHNRRQLKFQGHYAPKLAKAITNQYKAFVNTVKERGYDYAKSNIHVIVKFGEIAEIIKELYLKAAYVESNYVLNYLRKKSKSQREFLFEQKRVKPKFGIGFDDLAPVIDQYFQLHLLNNAALPITATTKRIIMRHLIREVDSGKPLDQALRDFTDLAITGGGIYSLPRAVGIAKTESTRSMSFGGMIGAYMSGIDLDKVWVTSDDERVRGLPNYPAKYSHVNLDLDEADMRGSFYNGEPIKFPGDPDASIENIANCRCAMFFKEKDDPEEIDELRDIGNFLIDIFAGLLIGVGIEQLTNDTSEN